jgi:hypothetical protein
VKGYTHETQRMQQVLTGVFRFAVLFKKTVTKKWNINFNMQIVDKLILKTKHISPV